MRPGQRIIAGTRKAPSQLVFFSLRNGVMPPSGQRVHVRAVVGRVDHDRVVGDAEIVERLEQLADMAVVLDHAVGVFAEAAAALRCSGRTCVWRCMRVALNQQKNGLLACACRLMKSIAASDVSSSIVSMRFLVSGPVSSMVCLPTLPKRGSTVVIVVVGGLALEHAARAELRLERRVLRIVGMLRLLLGVEVIEVAEELVEAVHRRQVLVAVAEMVLAELAGGVAERLQRLGDGDVFAPAARAARRASRPWSGRCAGGTGR